MKMFKKAWQKRKKSALLGRPAKSPLKSMSIFNDSELAKIKNAESILENASGQCADNPLPNGDPIWKVAAVAKIVTDPQILNAHAMLSVTDFARYEQGKQL